MDFVARMFARLLYPIGISTDPNQVIIGRDDWLYLGDLHDQTRTVDRRIATTADEKLGKDIGSAAKAWEKYLSSQGVKVFRVMIGPNKETIYPEHMPIWSKTAWPNATDALLEGTSNEIFIDLRAPLLAAKLSQQEKLYYKTDTHWNALGAGIAFRSFARQVETAAADLVWPTESAYATVRINSRAGGDLAYFLRLNSYLVDSEPIMGLSSLMVKITQLDYYTKKVISQAPNGEVGPTSIPILVKSEGALNNKRVLWLRDSFGSAMSPFMAATFSDVLQLHWREGLKTPTHFIKLIEDFKPEYVFFTVVERSSRAEVFTLYPPSIPATK